MERMTDEAGELAVARHFRLHLQQAVLGLLVHGAQRSGSIAALLDAQPFLVAYANDMAEQGLEGVSLDESASLWRRSVLDWEAGHADRHLPLRALREALDLDAESVELLMNIGLVEEDGRFGALFEHYAGRSCGARPSLGVLAEIGAEALEAAGWRQRLQRLREAGLVTIANPDAPASAWIPQVPLPVWEALRGEPPQGGASAFEFLPLRALPRLDELILDDAMRAQCTRLLPMLAHGETQALVLRGAQHNGRRSLLQALARELGWSVLLVEREAAEREPARLALMATLLDAMPVLAIEAAPGETVTLPALEAWRGAIGIALGREGGLSGARMATALSFELPVPDPACRRLLWNLGDAGDADQIPDLRMSSGHIRRAVQLAANYAALDGSAAVGLAHRRRAAASLGHESLDGLASRVPPLGGDAELVLTADTAEEFAALAARCRHRERLGDTVGVAFGTQFGCGVRALLRGPSGCGKTMAARKLAALLGRELYRVDLAAVVNKYIGETEKKLARVLDRAEEVDVVLLFDEGDALLGKRTAVQNSTDRYSNLETNFLLQRLDEGFGGILVITTNAAEQIDTAFRRRMDAVIDFRLPDALERHALWRLHLPTPHGVAEDYLTEVAFRCAFAGGQIRNAVLHAALLALQDGAPLATAHLDAAIRREYRKGGAVCPLRGAALRA